MSDSPSPRPLPARPSLEWLKKTAKARLAALRAADPTAILATAQRAVARDHGFPSWRALVARVKELQAAGAPLPTDAKAMQAHFRDAVRGHWTGEIERCLAADPTLVNAPLGDFGARPVSVANGHLPTIDVLLAHGADLNLKSDWWAGGWHILDTADEAAAGPLIDRGATVDVFAAAHLNRLDRLRELLDADRALVHAKGGDGGRPLHFATSVEAIDLLLARGADIDARDVDHESTAAQWAVPRPPAERVPGEHHRRGLARVRHLVARGAAVDAFLLAAIDDAGRMAALVDGDPDIIEVRVGSKTYPACPDAPGRHIYVYVLNEGRTPFEIAKAFGSAACMDVLLARSTPRQRFLAACATGDRAAVTALLREQPGVMQTLRPDDANVLPNAAWAGSLEAVVLMLDLGFDPAAMPNTSASALHCAAWFGRAELASAILHHPAVRPRWAELIAVIEPTYKSTPLGWCCHGSTQCRNPAGDYPAVAKLLLEAGAVRGPNDSDASAPVRAVLERYDGKR